MTKTEDVILGSMAADLRFSGIQVQSAALSALDELSCEICHAFATVSSDPEIPILPVLLYLTVIGGLPCICLRQRLPRLWKKSC